MPIFPCQLFDFLYKFRYIVDKIIIGLFERTDIVSRKFITK